MKLRVAIFASVGFSILAMASNAFAQGAFDRDRNISVRERPRPEYQARGLHLGGFYAYPKLTAGAESNDNIFAAEKRVESDTIYVLQPELVIQSDWSRNRLQLFVRGTRRMYADFPKESSSDYQYGGSGYVDAGNSRIIAGADYGRFVEPRTSGTTATGSAKPVRYDLGQANIGIVHTFNRLRLAGRVDLQDYDFKNTRTAAGKVILQDDRDRQVTTYAGRAEYAVSPDTSIFLNLAADDRRYDLQPPKTTNNRDSSGVNIAAGANFDLTALVRGEFQLGYVNQDYESAAFKNVKGLSTKALIEWFPSELDTVTLTASRAVEDAVLPGSGGFLSGNYAVQLDHELLRNLILTGKAGIGKDEYVGADRTDDRTSFYLGANYLLNQGVGVSLFYDYLKQDSSGKLRGAKFDVQRVMLSTSLQF